jgi:hypothetical protein
MYVSKMGGAKEAPLNKEIAHSAPAPQEKVAKRKK